VRDDPHIFWAFGQELHVTNRIRIDVLLPFREIQNHSQSRQIPVCSAAEISDDRETLNFSTRPAEIPSSRYLPKNGTRAFALTPYRT